MVDITKEVAAYGKGIRIKSLSCATGISYAVLQPCFSGKRKLRADEFLKICVFLEVPADRFMQEHVN